MNKIVSILKKNRKLLENFSALTVVQGINIIIPIFTLPYILRVGGTDQYGVFVLATSLLIYLQGITDFGYVITATRDVAFHRHNKKNLDFICSKVITVQLFLFVICTFIFLILLLVVPSFKEHSGIFILSFLMLFGYSIFPSWYFQGIEKMKYITIFSAGTRVAFTACIFIFIKERSDFYLYPLFNSLGYIVAGLYAQYIIFTKFKFNIIWVGWRRIQNDLNQNFNVFVNQFFPILYNNSTTFILGTMVNNSTLGLYGASKSIIEVAVKIISIISRVFFPHLNRNFSSFLKFKTLMICTGWFFFTIVCISSSYIVRYFHLSGEYAQIILCILALGIPFTSMYSCYGTNYFLIKRKEALVMKNTIAASLIGFVLAFPLSYFFAGVGAAINVTLSRAIMGIGLWLKYRKAV